MKPINKYLLVLCFSIAINAHAQNIDSLKQIIVTTKNDSLKIIAYAAWDNLIYATDADLDLKINIRIAKICEWQLKKRLNTKKRNYFNHNLGEANNNIGLVLYSRSDFKGAIEAYQKSISIRKQLGNVKGIADSYNNMGNIYKDEANYPMALKTFYKALKEYSKIKDDARLATVLGNIGNVFVDQENDQKALSYFNQALSLGKKLNNQNVIVANLGNMGIAYQSSNPEKALDYYSKALDIYNENGNKAEIGRLDGNIGTIYQDRGNYDKALKHYEKSIKIYREIGNINGLIHMLANNGLAYLSLKKYKDAEINLQESIILSKQLVSYRGLQTANKYLSILYETTGRNKLAFHHYKEFIRATDTISNNESTKKQTQLEMTYEFDKKQAADSIQTAERTKNEKIKHEQEIQQQKMYTYGGIIGFGLMLIVAFVSFRAFRNKKKANLVIALQKELVEEKQREILDSIHYAKRIQQSLLPNEKYINRSLRNHLSQ